MANTNNSISVSKTVINEHIVQIGIEVSMCIFRTQDVFCMFFVSFYLNLTKENFDLETRHRNKW